MTHFEYPGLDTLLSHDLSPLEQVSVRHDMRNAFWGIVQHPPNGSAVYSAFGYAAWEAMQKPEDHPKFNDFIDTFNSSRQNLPVEHRVQLLRIGFQYALMRADENYPINGEDKDQWHAWFDCILDDEYLRADLEEAVWTFNNQANWPQRMAGEKIAYAAHADILPDPADLVDAGTSAGLGLVQLKDNLPFSRITVRHPSKVARRLVHRAVNEPLNIGRAVGFDILAGANKYWVEACTYYDSDLRKAVLRRHRDQLYRQRSHIKIVQGDLAAGDDEDGLSEVRGQLKDGKADIGSAVNCLYEVHPDHLYEATLSFESLIKFLAITQDSAEIDPNDPTRLIYNRDIYAPSAHYNLFSKEVHAPGQPQVHLGRWLTFRCNTFVPTDECIDRLDKQAA